MYSDTGSNLFPWNILKTDDQMVKTEAILQNTSVVIIHQNLKSTSKLKIVYKNVSRKI